MNTMPSDLTVAPHAAHEPTRMPADPGVSGGGDLSDASDGPLGSAPQLAAGMAAQRAKQAIKARLFPQRLELAPHIGRFTVLRELGRGGMGVVYMAYDEALDRRVAIKLLYEISGDDAEAQTRLLREAQAMARLNHPNIAAVYEVGTHEGRVFIAMEFVEGQPLDVWLRDAPRAWSEVVEVFIQAGRGLHAAHCAGLVHRDFKPANVMLGSDGRVRVLDFGLARGAQVIDPDAELGGLSTTSVTMPALAATLASPRKLGSPLTEAGTIVGTPAYMPPEQFRGKPLDARADQYALCVSLYEGLHRRLPFTGDTLAELWACVLSGPPRTPPRGTRVPTWLHRVLLRGLAADPAQRFPSMAALLAALERQPRRRLRAGLLVALAASTLAGVAYGVDQYHSAQCRFEDELVGLWDTDTRARLRETFERDGSNEATVAWVRAEALLDDYTKKRVGSRRLACETYRRGEDSAITYERRNHCFTRSRLAIQATVNALSQLEVRSADRVEQAAKPLALVADCASRSMSVVGIDPPASASQERVEALYSELYRIEAQRADRITPALLEASRGVVQWAQTIDYAPATAEALRQRSSLEWYSGLKVEACATLRASYIEAERARHDAVAAIDAGDIIELCPDLGPEERIMWAKIAVAKTERSGGELDPLRVNVLAQVSMGLLKASQAADMEPFITSALGIVQARPDLFSGAGSGTVEVVRLVYIAGRFLRETADDATRARVRAALVGTFTSLYPGEPPDVVMARISEQDYMERAENGDWSGARAVSESVVATLRGMQRNEPRLLALWLAYLAGAELEMESCRSALGSVHKALGVIAGSQTARGFDGLIVLSTAIGVHAACGDPGIVAPLMIELEGAIDRSNSMENMIFDRISASVDSQVHDGKMAVQLAEEVLAVSELYVAPLSPSAHISALRDHAQYAVKAGQHEKARVSAEQVVAWIEETWDSSNVALAAPLTVLGRVELAAGNISRAVEHLQRALALREASDPQFRADTAFVLAQALKQSPGASARAREIGEQALRDYEAAGPRRTAEHAEVQAWLAGL